MKIAIVGLLPQQANLIRHEFSYLNLNFVPKQRDRVVEEATASSDKVIMMTKFIGHSTYKSVPREKLIHCPGGLSALRVELSNLALARNENPTPPPVQEPAVSDVTETINSVNLNPLAERPPPGTLLLLPRPKNISNKVWESRISANRSYYRRRYGVVTEHSLRPDGTAEVIVKELEPEKGSKPAPPPTPAAQPEQPTPATHTRPPATGKFEDEEHAFWRQVFLLDKQQNPGAPQPHHAEAADYAVKALRKRFN